MRGKYFEEFNEGDTYITSRRTIRESDLVNFCNLCWFNLSMFFDEHYATKDMPFKSPVLPGPFIIPLAVGLFLKLGLYERTAIALLGIQNLKFKAPLRVNDTMEVEFKVLSKKESKTYPDKGILTVRFTVNKINADLSKEFIMQFEMVHMVKRT
jgi:acyl dehydratase